MLGKKNYLFVLFITIMKRHLFILFRKKQRKELHYIVWNELDQFISNKLTLPSLTQQIATLGIMQQTEKNLLDNYLTLLFKFCIYNLEATEAAIQKCS